MSADNFGVVALRVDIDTSCARNICLSKLDWFDEFLHEVGDPNPVSKIETGSVETQRLSTHVGNFSVNVPSVGNVAIDLGVGMTQHDWFLVAFVAASPSPIHP